jgi:hypothetical protein
MSLATALILAAATASAPAPAAPSGGSGVQLVSAQARATIVEAVVVRQASGIEPDWDGPAPGISRRGRTILVEFQ